MCTRRWRLSLRWRTTVLLSEPGADPISNRRVRKETAGGGRHLEAAEEVLPTLCEAVESASITGHPMNAGLLSLAWPESTAGRLWRSCEMVREHRGDSHTNAWTSAGLDAVEINVLSEAWRGLPANSVTVYQMGWSRQQAADARFACSSLVCLMQMARLLRGARSFGTISKGRLIPRKLPSSRRWAPVCAMSQQFSNHLPASASNWLRNGTRRTRRLNSDQSTRRGRSFRTPRRDPLGSWFE